MIPVHSTRQRGFTLVELMIALLVGMILVMTMVTITRTMASETTNQQLIVEANQRARTGIHMLKNDLMRTGMFVSPSPRIDEDSLISDMQTNSPLAFYRNAVVHLNPGPINPDPLLVDENSDSFVLVGNFIGYRTYQASIEEGGSVITTLPLLTAAMCRKEFNGRYSFAHLINAQGQTLDAKVSGAVPTNVCDGELCQCQITLDPGELPEGAFAERNIKVAANQAVMYRVEKVDAGARTRFALVRYFINYSGRTPLTDGCTTVTADNTDIFTDTAVVIADYVQDFQIWFRTVTPDDDGSMFISKYHTVAALASGASGFRPDPSNVIVADALPGAATTESHLSCPLDELPLKGFGPEHVRSAMISLSVRGEKTDQQLGLNATQMAAANAEFNVAAAPAGQVGMYKVRTMTVEVPMPNLTASMARFQDGTPVY